MPRKPEIRVNRSFTQTALQQPDGKWWTSNGRTVEDWEVETWHRLIEASTGAALLDELLQALTQDPGGSEPDLSDRLGVLPEETLERLLTALHLLQVQARPVWDKHAERRYRPVGYSRALPNTEHVEPKEGLL